MYIADTVTSCPDILSLQIRRPIDRGYIVSFDLQRDIWSRCVRGVDGSLADPGSFGCAPAVVGGYDLPCLMSPLTNDRRALTQTLHPLSLQGL